MCVYVHICHICKGIQGGQKRELDAMNLVMDRCELCNMSIEILRLLEVQTQVLTAEPWRAGGDGKEVLEGEMWWRVKPVR